MWDGCFVEVRWMVRGLQVRSGRLLLPFRLKRLLPGAAREILRRLEASGHQAVLVGGCVRDLLLGRTPKDWDMATDLSIEGLLELFPEGKVMGADRQGQTLLIPREGLPYEVTPFRGPGLLGDLQLRDFTINAMALSPQGRLMDPMGGERDLAAGLLRACGAPADRIREDPLRMLRAVRLAADLSLDLDPSVVDAVSQSAHLLARVAPERIGAEFCRLMVTERPAWGMEQLRKTGLLAVFAPELLEMVGVEQNQYHAYTVWEHCLLALALAPPELPLRLAGLLHDVGKPRTVSTDSEGNRHFYRHEQVGAAMADALLERLRVEKRTRDRVVRLVRFHMDLHLEDGMSDSAIRRMISRVGLDLMGDLVQLRRADRLASGTKQGDLGPDTVYLLAQVERILKEDAALKVTDLAVDGNDVIRLFGRPPGPYVGDVLRNLLAEVMEEPERNQREWLLHRLEEMSRQ